MNRGEKVISETFANDDWFEDWWAGMDDRIYEDENVKDAVLMFRGEIIRLMLKKDGPLWMAWRQGWCDCEAVIMEALSNPSPPTETNHES
jgi:hypothetical protein